MVTRAWPCPGLLRLCRHARGGRGHCARRAASEFADVHISQRLLPTPFWVAREVKDYRLVRERAIIAYNGWIVAREARLSGESPARALDLVFYILIAAILGSRILHVAVSERDLFLENPLHLFKIWQGGLVFYGGLIASLIVAFFVIPKNKKTICDRKIDGEQIDWSNLRNWGGESERSDAKNCFYPIIVNPKNGKIIGFGEVSIDSYHPQSANVKNKEGIQVFPIDKEGVERKWRYARQSVEAVKHLLRAKKIERGYEIEIGKDFGTYKTVWVNSKYDANEYGTKIVKSLVPNCKFDFPKSLYNVYDCVYSVVAEDKNAIVLDFFAGSGTTAHAVLDLNNEDGGSRKFILCEQMHYVDTVTKERVAKVIKNSGKGSFIYAELKEWNEEYMTEIQKADTARKLLNIYERMQKEAFFRYDVDLSKFEIKEFEKLSLKEQKQILCECLDKNHLYVNLNEIDDGTYKVSVDDKKFNKEFYKPVA